MNFSGTLFITIFLPLTLFLYYAIKNRKLKNALLIVASLVFYAWADPIWMLLLVGVSVLVWLLAINMQTQDKKKSKLLLVIGVGIVLGILAVFKYSGFFMDNITRLLNIDNTFGGFSLPLGLSFYVFTCIAYLSDVYNGRVKAAKSFFDTLLFISMFFTVTSGPIQRFGDIQSDLHADRDSYAKVNYGVRRFIIGLAKKTILANTAGSLISSFTTSDYSKLTVQGAWIGIILFALQIYFDFSGYSDMAIGLASMFGFSLKENFRYPYISKSATEFWRRWHISLGSFFRDYVYIPLGGNRVSKGRWLLNIFIVWFLTGFWHGADWNFIAWGLYFFLLLLIERTFLQKLLNKLPNVISHIYFLLVMLIGWVFFNNSSLADAFRYIGVMFNIKAAALSDPILTILLKNNAWFILISIIATLPTAAWLHYFITKQELKLNSSKVLVFQHILVPIMYLALFVLAMIFLVGGTYTPFLYFNF